MNKPKTIEEISLEEAVSCWFSVISIEHHKDRDCRFKVIKEVKYGGEVSYYGYHNGYIMDEFHTEDYDAPAKAELEMKCKIIKECQEMLRWYRDREADSGFFGVSKLEVCSGRMLYEQYSWVLDINIGGSNCYELVT